MHCLLAIARTLALLHVSSLHIQINDMPIDSRDLRNVGIYIRSTLIHGLDEKAFFKIGVLRSMMHSTRRKVHSVMLPACTEDH